MTWPSLDEKVRRAIVNRQAQIALGGFDASIRESISAFQALLALEKLTNANDHDKHAAESGEAGLESIERQATALIELVTEELKQRGLAEGD